MAKRFTVTIYNPLIYESASADDASMKRAFNCALACLSSRENDELAAELFSDARRSMKKFRITRAGAFQCLGGFGVEIERI